MQFTEEMKDDVIIFRISGRIDAIVSPQLEKKIQTMIDEKHHKFLLDFFQVDYLSSAGMRLLLSVSKKLKSVGGKLVLSSIDDNVMEIIRMAGFNTILTITTDEEQALKELA